MLMTPIARRCYPCSKARSVCAKRTRKVSPVDRFSRRKKNDARGRVIKQKKKMSTKKIFSFFRIISPVVVSERSEPVGGKSKVALSLFKRPVTVLHAPIPTVIRVAAVRTYRYILLQWMISKSFRFGKT